MPGFVSWRCSTICVKAVSRATWNSKVWPGIASQAKVTAWSPTTGGLGAGGSGRSSKLRGSPQGPWSPSARTLARRQW